MNRPAQSAARMVCTKYVSAGTENVRLGPSLRGQARCLPTSQAGCLGPLRGRTFGVLYDAAMEDGSRLDALSLLMKGETPPARTAWAGVPASWCAMGAAAKKSTETRRNDQANLSINRGHESAF